MIRTFQENPSVSAASFTEKIGIQNNGPEGKGENQITVFPLLFPPPLVEPPFKLSHLGISKNFSPGAINRGNTVIFDPFYRIDFKIFLHCQLGMV